VPKLLRFFEFERAFVNSGESHQHTGQKKDAHYDVEKKKVIRIHEFLVLFANQTLPNQKKDVPIAPDTTKGNFVLSSPVMINGKTIAPKVS